MTVRLYPVFTPCVAPPPSMAAWWPLDETSGVTAFDIAGVPTNGAHVNGPTPTAGMVAGALSFDGANDYVQVADHPSLNFGQGHLSIDAWIKTSAASGVQILVDKRVEGATVQGYSLFLGNGTLGFQLGQGVGSPICSTAPGASCTNYPSGAFVANGQWPAHGQPLILGHRAVPGRAGRGGAVSARVDAGGGAEPLPGRQLGQV